MKALFVIITLNLLSANLSAQRYLTDQFPVLDSIIGGTYGTSINTELENQQLLFDFYEPKCDAELHRPLIIYIHGGGFTAGTRDYPSVKLLSRKMAKKGYAVASIDYRLDPTFDLYNSNDDRRAMTDAMHDAKQAIRYFKANAILYKLDTNKIFIGGESAGAITAMMASFVDKQSEMDIYPMANPNNPIGTGNLSYGNDVAATLCLCGLMLDTDAIEKPTDPPILWTHGSADNYIPLSLSNNIVLRAQNIGLPIQTKIYEGATHCPWYYGNPNWEVYLDSTIVDITTFLYPKVALPLGVKETKNQHIIQSIFPNPTADYTTIKLDKLYPLVTIKIISNLGQHISTTVYQDTRNILLNMGNLKSGLYTLNFNIGHRVLTHKIIKSE